VLLDGANVREVAVRSVRAAVAVVSDDPFLFSASVAENIAYARPDAPAAEIEQAARAAQAHEFISSLPQGYDTRWASVASRSPADSASVSRSRARCLPTRVC